MDEDWAHDHPIEVLFPNPYPTREFLYYLSKWLLGPFKRRNRGIVEFLPRDSPTPLNRISRVEYNLGFVGDIMVMDGHELEFDDRLLEFFSGVDVLVGNFEGTLTIQPRFVLSKRHDEAIIEQLSALVDDERSRLLLGVANNHSGDFGFADYILSINRLAWAGFNVFGRRDIGNFQHGRLNFVAGTQWSDQRACTYVPRLDDREDFFLEDYFNIYCPHWGFELEPWPRPSMVQLADDLLDNWDLIFAHHTHVPQPITKFEVGGVNKLVCFSAGNFTSSMLNRMHKWGLVAKCEVGPLEEDPDQLAVGRVSWTFTRSRKLKKRETRGTSDEVSKKGTILVEPVEENPYFRGV
ncbi:MAG: CapA family protein [Promethearchaeota archaeon]